jgi:hypothetical protein
MLVKASGPEPEPDVLVLERFERHQREGIGGSVRGSQGTAQAIEVLIAL